MAKRGSTKARKSANARPESPVKDVSEEEVSGTDSEDAPSLHSDALDEQSDDSVGRMAETRKKRRRGAPSSMRASSSKRKPSSVRTDSKSKQAVSEKKTPAKKRRKAVEDTAENEGDSDVVQLKDGQEVVGRVVQAPTTGWGTYGCSIEGSCVTHDSTFNSAGRPDISTHAEFLDTHARPRMQ